MMWTRKELKERAKEALQRNYWKIVLVSTLMLLLGGGVGFTGIGGGNRGTESQEAEELGAIEYDEDDADWGQEAPGKRHSFIEINEGEGQIIVMEEYRVAMVGLVIAAIIGVSIFLVIFAVIFAVDIFLFNPFSVGVDRFMLKSVDDTAQVKEIGYGFDHCYNNIVKTLFHRDLQIFLWALLFIIPGVYKKYQYRMVSYIMAEHPDMEYKRVLQMSKDMMNGHKWKAFVLDLSFILWHILGTITCGIVEIFYVQPYQQLTCAALYRRLNESDGNGMDVI